MAPVVVKGKVRVGNSEGELGVRGWLVALDAASGTVSWRAYGTGPDAEVLIGPEFKPFYAMDRGKDLGVSSWPPDAWKIGGGNVWGWISYDPELNLIYYGTANMAPPTRALGIPISAPATTSGPPGSLRGTPMTERHAGSASGVLTTCSITTV